MSAQDTIQYEPPRCISGLLVIHLLDWNNQPIQWHGKEGEGKYLIHIPYCEPFEHDFHAAPTLVVRDVAPGFAKVEFIGEVEGLIASLEQIPVPTYDQQDIDLKNGTCSDSELAIKNPGCQLPVDQLKAWAGTLCGPIEPSGSMPEYRPYAWISHTEREARTNGHWYQKSPYTHVGNDKTNTIPIGVNIPVKLQMDYTGQPASIHVIELTGRYAYVPWLEESTEPAYVNAANLAALADLAYGTVKLNENDSKTGSIGEVFQKMENFERPSRCNVTPATLVLRTVPYAMRFKSEDVYSFTCRRTGFRAFLAFSPDSIILGVSGLGKECYGSADDRKTSKQWQAAENYSELPFRGEDKDPDHVQMQERVMTLFPVSSPGNDSLPISIARTLADAFLSKVLEAMDNKKLHSGVYHAVFGLWAGISEVLQKLPQVPVFVGASCFGGPVAALLGGVLAETSRKVYLYTFGAPMAMSLELAKTVEAKLTCAWSYEAYEDSLTQDPSYGKFFDSFKAGVAVINLAKDLAMRNIPSVAYDIYKLNKVWVDTSYFPVGKQLFYMHEKGNGIVYKTENIYIMYLNAQKSRGILSKPSGDYEYTLEVSFRNSKDVHQGSWYAKIMAMELCNIYQSKNDPKIWENKCVSVVKRYLTLYGELVHNNETNAPTLYIDPYSKMITMENDKYISALNSEVRVIQEVAKSPPNVKTISGKELELELIREMELLARNPPKGII